MKLYKRWWFWLIVVVILAVAAFFLVPREVEVVYVTETVEVSDLIQTVDANGEVVSIDEVELSFDLSGTIESVLAAVGDVVEVGDVLLQLDTTELSADVSAAYQAVQVALSNLDQQRAGSTDEAIEVASLAADAAGVTKAMADVDVLDATELLTLTQVRYNADSDYAGAVAQTALDNYNQTVSANALSLADAYDDLLSAAWAGVVEARAGLGQADEVLGVNNGVFNDAYETVLSAQNTGVLETARTAFGSAESALIAAESAVLSAGYASSSGTIVSAAEAVEDALDAVARLLLYTDQVVQGTVTSGSFTASELSALIDAVDAARRAVQIDQAALQNAFQVVSGALIDADAALEDAANALSEAQANLDAKESLEAYSVATAEQALVDAEATADLRSIEFTKAQASLSEVEAAPRSVDLASFEAEVERTRAAYAAAQARLEKATISSPIVGSVTEVAVQEGEQVVGSETVVTVQTTEEQFEIVADISESDIAKVEEGDAVIMTFDAFGSGVELEGYIAEMDPAEKLIEGVVYYEVTVYLADPAEAIALRPGMSTDIVVTTDDRSGVVTVPQRAVKTDADGTYVNVLVDGESARRSVTTGLRGDLGRLEISEGLQEGDEVIIREIES